MKKTGLLIAAAAAALFLSGCSSTPEVTPVPAAPAVQPAEPVNACKDMSNCKSMSSCKAAHKKCRHHHRRHHSSSAATSSGPSMPTTPSATGDAASPTQQ